MTQEELFADLKQFILATISQQLADVVRKDDLQEKLKDFATKEDLKELATKADVAKLKADLVNLKDDVEVLDMKLDTIQDAIAENIETANTKLQNHEGRLQRLEHKFV